ncbi:MAG: hypothetical protein ACO3AQ_07325 [Bacteroidia bacterium]
MKKLINFTLMIAVCTIISLSGCKKYEDGPGLSLSSKKSRVAATWEFKKVKLSSVDVTSNFLDYTWEMKKDGQFNVVSSGYIDHGKWDFALDKEAIDFRYDDGTIERYDIKRLTAKDLWMEFIDSGDTLYIELSAK